MARRTSIRDQLIKLHDQRKEDFGSFAISNPHFASVSFWETVLAEAEREYRVAKIHEEQWNKGIREPKE